MYMNTIQKISVTLVNYFLSKRYGVKNIDNFIRLLSDVDNWQEKSRDEHVYTYVKNPAFTIHIPEEREEITQDWVKVFPDKQSDYLYDVKMKIDGVTVEEVPFMYLDGFRYFVPWPEIGEKREEISVDPESFYRYWNLSSLAFKLLPIIGSPGTVEDAISRVAKRLKIEVVNL